MSCATAYRSCGSCSRCSPAAQYCYSLQCGICRAAASWCLCCYALCDSKYPMLLQLCVTVVAGVTLAAFADVPLPFTCFPPTLKTGPSEITQKPQGGLQCNSSITITDAQDVAQLHYKGAPTHWLLSTLLSSHGSIPAVRRDVCILSVYAAGQAPSAVARTAPLYDRPAAAAAPE